MQLELTAEQNAIIAARFPDDPASAIRAQSAVLEILSKLSAAGEPVAWRYQTATGWHATTDAGKALAVKEHHPIEALYTAPQAGAETRPLSQYGYQTLFDAISAATWTTADGDIEISVQAFRDALKSAPAAEASAKGEEPDIQEKLKDPNVVHVNMLRGTIAPITFDQLAHVLGDEATAKWIADRQQRKESNHAPRT